MPLKLYLRATSLFTLFIGVIFFIIPSQAAEFFTGQPLSNGQVFLMFLGTSLFGYSVLNWSASTFRSSQALRAVLLSNAAALMAACPLSVYAYLSSQLNNAGLLILAIHFGFAGGFIYYLKQAPANIQLK